jgi:hypothetical protein
MDLSTPKNSLSFPVIFLFLIQRTLHFIKNPRAVSALLSSLGHCPSPPELDLNIPISLF